MRWCCGSGASTATQDDEPVSLLVPAYIWPEPVAYAQLVQSS